MRRNPRTRKSILQKRKSDRLKNCDCRLGEKEQEILEVQHVPQKKTSRIPDSIGRPIPEERLTTNCSLTNSGGSPSGGCLRASPSGEHFLFPVSERRLEEPRPGGRPPNLVFLWCEGRPTKTVRRGCQLTTPRHVVRETVRFARVSTREIPGSDNSTNVPGMQGSPDPDSHGESRRTNDPTHRLVRGGGDQHLRGKGQTPRCWSQVADLLEINRANLGVLSGGADGLEKVELVGRWPDDHDRCGTPD